MSILITEEFELCIGIVNSHDSIKKSARVERWIKEMIVRRRVHDSRVIIISGWVIKNDK
jgi:hypothetical protein